MKIAIASGKGGTGKTTVASNMAYALARAGWKAAYIDCDVEEPDGHIFINPEKATSTDVSVKIPQVHLDKCNFCGTCADVCRFNALAVLADKVLVFPSLCHGCGACYHLCPEKAIEEIDRPIGVINDGTGQGVHFMEGRLNIGEAISPPLTRVLKRNMPDSGVSFIDAPPGTSCPAIEAVSDTDYVILVTEPTPFGLNDLKLAVEMVRALGLPFGVIINRADIGDSRVADYCAGENIEILKSIPFDRHAAETYSRGELIAENNREFGDSLISVYEKIENRIAADGTGNTQR